MQSSTYVSRRPGPFADLIAVSDLGGFRLSPLAPLRVRDQYWDTADNELLRSGLSLRVRDQGGTRTAALRPVGPDGDRVADAALGPEDGAPVLVLPPGPLADAVAERIGADTLRPLLALRQYRTPRIAYDAARPALLVSLDVVVYEVPGAQVVSNEVEVEVTSQGGPDDVARLDAALQGFDLAAVPRSKLERGLLRLPRTLAEPVLLLPDERTAVERLAERGDPAQRRRARVLLLDARGYRADTVASQTGLSTTRVRHWKEQFLEHRLAVFEPEPAADGVEVATVEVRRLIEPDAPPEPAPPEPAPPEPVAPQTTPPQTAPPQTAALPEPTGDSVSPPETLGVLMDQFAPAATDTPFLDADEVPDHDADDDSDQRADRDADLGQEDVPSEPGAPPAAEAVPAEAVPAEAAPGEVEQSLGAPAHDPDAQDPPEAVETADAAPAALRAPTLRAETPLLDAALATLVYHVARFEAAADRLDRAPGTDAARRVLLAAHRVRLAAEAFGPTVPAMAAGRLVAALRPLVAALDDALDHDRAAHASAAHAEARDRALGRARAHLHGGRHRAWGPRARRLLDRLGAQHGLLVGDDFPAPPDDLVGERGDVPVPSRLRHAAASMLWARYEAIRAFEDEVAAPSAATVYHLALAVSGLHFVLGLVALAPSASVRALAARLDAAEARLAAVRAALRTAEITGADVPPAPAVADVWADLASPEFRHALAGVAAQI